jgi:hypothetical protein
MKGDNCDILIDRPSTGSCRGCKSCKYSEAVEFAQSKVIGFRTLSMKRLTVDADQNKLSSVVRLAWPMVNI